MTYLPVCTTVTTWPGRERIRVLVDNAKASAGPLACMWQDKVNPKFATHPFTFA
jgi:hypothetical protein